MTNVPAYQIIHEQLSDKGTDLTSIYFRYGCNIYVFSYQKEGVRKHTLVDASDFRHSNEIISILRENQIDPRAIERIIITHRHPDHCGLAHILAKESDAKIIVHSNFKGFVEGKIPVFERLWLGLYDPKELINCDVQYLTPKNGDDLIDIGGLKFPRLMEPVGIGDSGKLEILAIPESKESHSPDQLIALYSPGSHSHLSGESHNGYRPSDDMLFSGDLWLMKGPVSDKKMRRPLFILRNVYRWINGLLSGKGWRGTSIMEQDLVVKEALKVHFSLIRVKPGHGEEFLGSRIIPQGFPADRDLLDKLGYSSSVKRSLIKSGQLAAKMENLKEQAYASFIREVLFWKEQGYSFGEIAELLVRIYQEQTGGSPQVAQDRKQRRDRILATLARLKQDQTRSNDLRQLAETTLKKLESVNYYGEQ